MHWAASTAALFCFAFQVLCVNAKINIIYNYNVESIVEKNAQLHCKIDTDKIVKLVAWYRHSDTAPKEHVYYLEPPKFNTSAPDYKGRVRLASDQSSLIFRSVTKEDEGLYECRVQVVSNTSSHLDEIPEEASQLMKLTVHIPPTSVKLTSFTSNKNMSLTCRATGSKPQADVFWLVKRKNEVQEYRSTKIVTEYQGDLTDTIGYFYVSLSQRDQGVIIYCMVEHPQTQTTLRDNVTLVAPTLQHPVMMYFDWLGGEVPYFAYDTINNDEQPAELPSGIVEMAVNPSQRVEGNSTVVVTVTSNSFPEPRYTWWSEDLDLRSGRVIRLDSIQRNQQLFCLVENPVGRVVVSMQIAVAGSESSDSDSDSSGLSGDVAVSGVLIMAIVFGVLVLVLVAAFLVYYCAFKPSKEEDQQAAPDEGNDFDSYVVKQKLPDSEEQLSGQAKISTYHVDPELLSSNEKQALLKTALDSPNMTPPVKHRKKDDVSRITSSTSTSGIGGDLGGSNGVDDNRRSPSEGKKRAISQHLQDFDENASFVGDYGSSFGLDEAPGASDSSSDKESSQHESDSDEGNYDSGTSGVEGRYTVPPSGSWDNIDPSQVVLPQQRSTDI